MDSAEFHAAVYEAVRHIPVARVTSYGTPLVLHDPLSKAATVASMQATSRNSLACPHIHDTSAKVLSTVVIESYSINTLNSIEVHLA